ncbi:hypothetical protein [Vibrio scophthalmi]|uniref:Uncharacterized protein n=1 Tax=Vibrio scophthalmi TaxID=45658 RepID=A0A1E3WIS0_9VIBR|nr:hypothetical protein [Vibrio scophthalmi]ODS09630.1 hypothetical protein VSF3289_03294 [Vibrio scophthalmi]
MFQNKFIYRLDAKGDDLGEVVLINPIAIGEAIKVACKSYRVTDIWHGEAGSIAHVERID